MLNSNFKKILLVIILLFLNLIIYYFLTEYYIERTFSEISTVLISSFIGTPIFLLFPTTFLYLLSLLGLKHISFKELFLKLYFFTSIGVYSIMILIAVLTYFKVR